MTAKREVPRKSVLVRLEPKLLAAIDERRGEMDRQKWIEAVLLSACYLKHAMAAADEAARKATPAVEQLGAALRVAKASRPAKPKVGKPQVAAKPAAKRPIAGFTTDGSPIYR